MIVFGKRLEVIRYWRTLRNANASIFLCKGITCNTEIPNSKRYVKHDGVECNLSKIEGRQENFSHFIIYGPLRLNPSSNALFGVKTIYHQDLIVRGVWTKKCY